MRRREEHLLSYVFHHRLFLVFNLALFVFLAFSFGRESLRNANIQATITQLEIQASEIEGRNVEIARINAELESESFLEREARLRLGLVKPGERVVVVSDTPASDVDIGGEKVSSVILEHLPNRAIRRWQAYFFDTKTFDRLKLLERPRL